jgi:benzodiazapine receptor
MIKILTWVLFYACTVTAAATAFWFVGDLNANGWVSPSFAPPSWLFGPVWTLLYLMIATSAYRISQSKRHEFKTLALALWAFQMTLNTLWTPVFFGAYDLWGAFYIILVLWAAIGAFTVLSWRIDRGAAYLFMPYWAWVTFAGVLNFGYITIN